MPSLPLVGEARIPWCHLMCRQCLGFPYGRKFFVLIFFKPGSKQDPHLALVFTLTNTFNHEQPPPQHLTRCVWHGPVEKPCSLSHRKSHGMSHRVGSPACFLRTAPQHRRAAGTQRRGTCV